MKTLKGEAQSRCTELFSEYLKRDDKNYLEIGIFDGVFFATLADMFPDKMFFGVDPFYPDARNREIGATPERFELSKEYAMYNCEGVSNIQLFPQTSQDFFEEHKSLIGELNLSFIYVDGSHMREAVLIDAEKSFQFLSEHGYIVFDDTQEVGVYAAVKWFENKYKDCIVSKREEGRCNLYEIQKEKS